MERRDQGRRAGGRARAATIDRLAGVLSLLSATIRVVTDPEVTAALDALANALDAHVSGKEQVVAVVEGEREPTVLVPSVVPEVTDEHRRFAERRLRKAGVLR